MENKINIAELLKDCPRGMELDCAMFENLHFDYVENQDKTQCIYSIRCYVDDNGFRHIVRFTKYGESYAYNNAKCIIFPKGKDTWAGFVPPCKFMDGDIVVTTLNNIAIISEHVKKELFYIHALMVGDNFYNDGNTQVFVKRLATEEEKEKLFKEIEKNGYRWNFHARRLEKLIEPKFKVGDKVRKKGDSKYHIIEDECTTFYTLDSIGRIDFTDQDEWELVPNKFDINTLVPFVDKVLVRDEKTEKWFPATWGFYDDSYKFNYIVEGGNGFNMCIPYKGNEHLLGTTDDCSEYYKTLED